MRKDIEYMLIQPSIVAMPNVRAERSRPRKQQIAPLNQVFFFMLGRGEIELGRRIIQILNANNRKPMFFPFNRFKRSSIHILRKFTD